MCASSFWNGGFKAFQYEKKIYIIEKADTLNIQSQNALLKTLEEPPAHAVFLLLAERARHFCRRFFPVWW